MIACPVDEFIPLPVTSRKKATGVEYAALRERAKAACNAAALLTESGYQDAPPDIDLTRVIAQTALRAVINGNAAQETQVNAALTTPEGCTYVDTILRAYDREVVKDAQRLRHYVTNKLIVEAENADPRIRMRALELLGKVSDVGLFTERTEITVNNRSTVELENSLREKLSTLLNKNTAEDAVILPPPPNIAQPQAKEMLSGLVGNA
jgi:hypothetical protein